MSGIELIQSFLKQADVKSARSTVLNPLGWLNAILLGGLSSCLYFKSPGWLLILIAVFLSIGVIMYLSSYAYFALRFPDYLRSERFTLSKMVIEKSIKGDNLTGLIDPSLQMQGWLLPNASEEPKEVANEQ